MNWYFKVLKQYVDFEGRARRKEYWMFTLFNILFGVIAIVLDNVLNLRAIGLPYGLFYFIYALGVFLPSLAVAIRRLHDVGKSGWMILIAIIPIIGSIWLLVLMVTDSVSGENRYGPNPKNSDVNKVTNKEEVKRDTIILLVIIWMIVGRLFFALQDHFLYLYNSTIWYSIFLFLRGFVLSIVPLGLAFALNNKSQRIIFFILGGLYLIYELYLFLMHYIF